MKKLFKVLVCLVLTLAVCVTLTACTKEETLKLGMGVEVNLDSTKETTVQIDATIAAVVLDKDGKITMCRIDAIQNKATLSSGDYSITNLKTKMELGDDYGMAKWGQNQDANGDGIVKEWYDQAKAFENYVVGMTAEDVKNIKTAANSHGYQMATDEALLNAGCTIQITDFIAAVYKACTDEQGTEFTVSSKDAYTLGVGATSFGDASSKKVEGDTDGAINIYSDMAATVVVDGKIVACVNDAIQPKVSFNKEGVTNKTFVNTKRCLKEDYNMKKYGQDANDDGVVKEWYEQSRAFSDFVVGKTADDVHGILTEQNKLGYNMAINTDLLAAGCTIQITGMREVVVKAANSAR